MPRVENVGTNVDEWYRQPGQGSGSSTFDVCRFCHKVLVRNPHAFNHKLKPYNGDPDGDRGREGECDHPPYVECGYNCAACGAPLTHLDD